jgi:hypothetical protein
MVFKKHLDIELDSCVGILLKKAIDTNIFIASAAE